MPTLRDPAERAAIVARLRQMSPDRKGRWGRLTSAAALCHMSDQFRGALGVIDCVPHRTLFSRTIGKWLVVDTRMPAPPGRIQTSPEMLTTPPGRFVEDLAECVRLMEQVGTERPMGVHPTFGPMDPAEWGRMGWKHTDHHLQQFGL